MTTTGEIVVGVDGSAESRQALEFALAEAAKRGRGVHVVAAYYPPRYWALPGACRPRSRNRRSPSG